MKIILSTILSLFLINSGFAQGGASGLSVKNALVRLLPPSAKTTAAYMTLSNPTDKPIRIESVACEIAEKCEIHENITDGAVMKMREKSGVIIAAQSQWVLAPQRDHIMMINLKNPLKEGQVVAINFKTAQGATLAVQAVVTKMEIMNEGAHHH